jgi:hypothetical protein
MRDKFLEAMMIALAVYSILVLWFRGSVFEGCHGWFEAKRGWIHELASCPICLTPHLSFWLMLFFLVPGAIVSGGWVEYLFLPLQYLVILGMVYVLNSEWPVKPPPVNFYSERSYVPVATAVPTARTAPPNP